MTNRIKTIEKIIRFFNLTEIPSTMSKFKTKVYSNIQNKYIDNWTSKLRGNRSPRLLFYGKIKRNFLFETYLELPNFYQRKIIAKFRCSDHVLEIEKGRHLKVPREERFCRFCTNAEIESEEHFLSDCPLYKDLRTTRSIFAIRHDIYDSFIHTYPETLGSFLLSAFQIRQQNIIAAEYLR